MPPRRPHRPWWGVNVVGHLRAEAGLGEAARLTIAALDACGVPVLPVEPAIRPPTRQALEFASITPAEAGFPINLMAMSGHGVSEVDREVGGDLFRDRFTIGQCWWEVDAPVPSEWRPGLLLFQEGWAPTEHVRKAFAKQLAVDVVKMPMPVEVSEPPEMTRHALGLPEGFLYLFAFDYGGSLKRKNPSAVIEAFTRAFEPGEGAVLVIKCVNPHYDPAGHASLCALAARHPDVSILEWFATSDEKNAIIDACDCYVSLHRAEGFGFTLAEAMYFGKPVIASRFSGNLDFMTDRNSYLVDCTPAEVGENLLGYPPTAVWAEPSVAHAAALMRRVFEDRDAARAVGARGAGDLRRTHSPSVVGELMRSRLEEIAAGLRARGWAAGQLDERPAGREKHHALGFELEQAHHRAAELLRIRGGARGGS